MPTLTRTEWDSFLAGHPKAHLLQSGEWGDLKGDFDWTPERIRVGESGAQILFRRLPLGLTIAYIPKGPVGEDWSALWPEVDVMCRRRRAILLKVEPDAWEDEDADLAVKMSGFIPSSAIQPRRTVLIDLLGSEEDWLARMKPKTRYNIRLAQKKEVVIRESNDLDAFQQLMMATGSRDGFGVHTLAYYRRVYDLFTATGKAVLLQAEYQGRPLAAIMAFATGERAWYLYGASSDEERNRMPTYLLQWEAMRWAAARGCKTYDLWGVPDEDEQTLESQFEQRSDGLWGVYRFKRGFGGRLMRSVRAWDRVYQPLLYQVYLRVVKRSREG